MDLMFETALVLRGSASAHPKSSASPVATRTRAKLEEARRSVLDLRAAPLEGRTLAEALAALGEAHAHERHLPVNFEVIGGNRPLPVRVEVGLYRVAQEALTNVARHAQARRVEVNIQKLSDCICMKITDDGKSFNVERTLNANGGKRLGLLGMRERLEMVGGNLVVESAPGAGTTVQARIPLGKPRPRRESR